MAWRCRFSMSGTALSESAEKCVSAEDASGSRPLAPQSEDEAPSVSGVDFITSLLDKSAQSLHLIDHMREDSNCNFSAQKRQRDIFPLHLLLETICSDEPMPLSSEMCLILANNLIIALTVLYATRASQCTRSPTTAQRSVQTIQWNRCVRFMRRLSHSDIFVSQEDAKHWCLLVEAALQLLTITAQLNESTSWERQA